MVCTSDGAHLAAAVHLYSFISNNLTLALTAAEERASAAAACNDASSCTLDDVVVVELSPSPPEVLLTADGSVLTGASPLSLY